MIESQILKCLCDKPSFFQFRTAPGSVSAVYLGYRYGDRYSSRCSFSKKIHIFKIKVPRFLKIEKEEVGGLYNLECILIKKIGEVELFKAKWLKKMRGFNFTVENGFIASYENYNFHSVNSENEAIDGLRKKITGEEKLHKINEQTKIGIKLFKKLTGACSPGIENFCNKCSISKKQYKAIDLINILRNNNQNHYADLIEKKLLLQK